MPVATALALATVALFSTAAGAVSPAEKQALVDLYNTNGGASWGWADQWMQGAHVTNCIVLRQEVALGLALPFLATKADHPLPPPPYPSPSQPFWHHKPKVIWSRIKWNQLGR